MSKKALPLLSCLISIGKDFPDFEPHLVLDDARGVVDGDYAYILNCREDSAFVEDVIVGLKPSGLQMLKLVPAFAKTYLNDQDLKTFRSNYDDPTHYFN